jgi:diguanylate cyclase (GGDEF)-like protein
MSAPPALRQRLRRTGVLVVGGSTFASAAFVHLAFTFFGDVEYVSSMVMAVIIPIIVSGLAFSWIAALTLRLEASRKELEFLANQDQLTKLANRRAALARLAEWSDAPVQTTLALAMADIDFFKRVNDKLGHDGGDASLVHFAAMLGKLLPPGWLVARVGGEEFLIAALTTDFSAFAERIEAVRMAVADTPFITQAGPYRLTVSFGLAARAPGELITRLITRADTALYAAKQAGRNRTERAA